MVHVRSRLFDPGRCGPQIHAIRNASFRAPV